MPVQHEIKKGKGRRATDLPLTATPNHALRRNDDPGEPRGDEDNLYDPDWEAASDAELEAYIDVSLKE